MNKYDLLGHHGENLAKSFFNGLTLGYGDNGLNAARAGWDELRGGDFSDSYNRYQTEWHEDLNRFREQHPTHAMLAETAGGIAQFMPAVGVASLVAKGAAGLGKLARSPMAQKLVERAHDLAKKAEPHALPILGGVEGGLYSVGDQLHNGEDFDGWRVLRDIAIGTGIGAGFKWGPEAVRAARNRLGIYNPRHLPVVWKPESTSSNVIKKSGVGGGTISAIHMAEALRRRAGESPDEINQQTNEKGATNEDMAKALRARAEALRESADENSTNATAEHSGSPVSQSPANHTAVTAKRTRHHTTYAGLENIPRQDGQATDYSSWLRDRAGLAPEAARHLDEASQYLATRHGIRVDDVMNVLDSANDIRLSSAKITPDPESGNVTFEIEFRATQSHPHAKSVQDGSAPIAGRRTLAFTREDVDGRLVVRDIDVQFEDWARHNDAAGIQSPVQQINANLIRLFQQMDEPPVITASAGNERGGLVWAQQGFVPLHAEEAVRKLTTKFQNSLTNPKSLASQMSDSDKELMSSMIQSISEDRTRIWQVAGFEDQSGNKVGKELLTGAGYEVVFDPLDDDMLKRFTKWTKHDVQ